MLPTESLIGDMSSYLKILRQPGWTDYYSIVKDGTFAETVGDNPLLIVHPGLAKLHPWARHHIDGQWREYSNYLKNLADARLQAVTQDRSVLVFCHSDFLRQTLKIIPWSPKLLLVPTINSTVYHSFYGQIEVAGMETNSNLLGLTGGFEFYSLLAQTITRAETAGEFGNSRSCLDGMETKLKQAGVRIKRLKPCTFSFQ